MSNNNNKLIFLKLESPVPDIVYSKLYAFLTIQKRNIVLNVYYRQNKETL